MKNDQAYRILIIDDDPAIHGLFGTLLGPQTAPRNGRPNISPAGKPAQAEDFPIFEIDSAYDGEKGLGFVRTALAERRPYTMAFVDLRMKHGWGGIETISHIWKECFDLQIIICTGHADFTWHGIIQQFGHSDRLLILKKPFDLTEVRQMAYSLAEKWNLAHQAQDHLERLQKLVTQRTAKLEEANLSLQRKIVENTRAERRLVAQYAVSQALAESATFADATDRIFKIVCENLDWDWGAIWIVDGESNTLQLANCWHVPTATCNAFEALGWEVPYSSGSGLPGRAWERGEPIWIQDIVQDGRLPTMSQSSEAGLHGALAFPIRVGNKIFGVIEFLSQDVRKRDDDLSQTFTVIGSSIGQFLERRQAELDLRKERDYIDRIIKEIPALVVGIAPDGSTTFINPSISRHTGYSSEELIGRNWWHLLYPETDYQQVDQLFRDLENGPVRDYEMVLTTKNGEKRTVSWNSMSKFDEAGRLTEIIGFGNDITERQRSEKERSSMEIQLRQAQKLESIGQLAAGIAHEINTPTQYLGDNIRFLQSSFSDLEGLHRQYERLLHGLRGDAGKDLIAETEQAASRVDVGFLLEEVPKAIQQSLEGVERIAKIVRAMKDFSHPGTGEKIPIDLNKAIETTLAVTRNEWKYVADVTTNFDANLPLVPCLPGEINQVILNLLVNAAHAIAAAGSTGTKSKGAITISTRQCGDWAQIDLQDSGVGIPERIRDKVFDPFFTTKPVGKGTGQNLAIARTVIVDKHAGALTFDSMVGRGTTFSIRLPLRQPAKPEEKR